MKKKGIGILLGLVILFLLGSFLLGDEEESSDLYDVESTESSQAGTGEERITTDSITDTASVPVTETPVSAGLTRGLEMYVSGETGNLSITRFDTFHGKKADADGIWTIFVYLCGTDLESGSAMATYDLEEMLSADSSDNVRYVIQTGGTEMWYNDQVDSRVIQRFVLQDGNMELVDEQTLEGLGLSSTLADFLTWGTAAYPSEHSGLVFWDHGGGSITGVCFDELADYDSLSLMEIDQALYSVSQTMGDKFDFIGFDACLMGTVETAAILATYADYMYGSEETEPG
nr:Clostripain family protein [Lachnospiraceae bacterium]